MGTATQVDRIEVLWPSGQQQVLTNVAVDQQLELIEPRFSLLAPVTVGGLSVLDLSSPNEVAMPYAMVMSFTEMPRTPLPGGRLLPLTLDALSGYSIVPGNVLLSNPLGVLDGSGAAASALSMPNQAFLQGMTFYATAATFDAAGFPVRTIFPSAVEITVQ